ncbi:unnamed protein product [Caenorhabditis bovis]|uniref:Uncharacterized protein n=1 Tax=Caenorhabditis bovis TaxID=2654633 RepID=A0A8S1EM11_9PELO|nr:unnamed protein product [Caenorhabditis bovis]
MLSRLLSEKNKCIFDYLKSWREEENENECQNGALVENLQKLINVIGSVSISIFVSELPKDKKRALNLKLHELKEAVGGKDEQLDEFLRCVEQRISMTKIGEKEGIIWIGLIPMIRQRIMQKESGIGAEARQPSMDDHGLDSNRTSSKAHSGIQSSGPEWTMVDYSGTKEQRKIVEKDIKPDECIAKFPKKTKENHQAPSGVPLSGPEETLDECSAMKENRRIVEEFKKLLEKEPELITFDIKPEECVGEFSKKTEEDNKEFKKILEHAKTSAMAADKQISEMTEKFTELRKKQNEESRETLAKIDEQIEENRRQFEKMAQNAEEAHREAIERLLREREESWRKFEARRDENSRRMRETIELIELVFRKKIEIQSRIQFWRDYVELLREELKNVEYCAKIWFQIVALLQTNYSERMQRVGLFEAGKLLQNVEKAHLAMCDEYEKLEILQSQNPENSMLAILMDSIHQIASKCYQVEGEIEKFMKLENAHKEELARMQSEFVKKNAKIEELNAKLRSEATAEEKARILKKIEETNENIKKMKNNFEQEQLRIHEEAKKRIEKEHLAKEELIKKLEQQMTKTAALQKAEIERLKDESNQLKMMTADEAERYQQRIAKIEADGNQKLEAIKKQIIEVEEKFATIKNGIQEKIRENILMSEEKLNELNKQREAFMLNIENKKNALQQHAVLQNTEIINAINERDSNRSINDEIDILKQTSNTLHMVFMRNLAMLETNVKMIANGQTTELRCNTAQFRDFLEEIGTTNNRIVENSKYQEYYRGIQQPQEAASTSLTNIEMCDKETIATKFGVFKCSISQLVKLIAEAPREETNQVTKALSSAIGKSIEKASTSNLAIQNRNDIESDNSDNNDVQKKSEKK